MTTCIAWKLNIPLDVARRATRETLIAHMRSALSNAGSRFNVLCTEAEVRTSQEPVGIFPVRGILVCMLSISNVPSVADYVMLDSIGIGAMKAATGSGWSVQGIRQRLNPTGSDSDAALPGFNEITAVSRIVTNASSCDLATVEGGIGQRQIVVDGVPGTAGTPRNSAPIIPPGLTDNIPLSYKIAGGVVVVGVGAIAAAYVWRAFK